MIEITSQYLAEQGLSETFPQRFWSKVNKTDGCWIWTGTRTNYRYGNIVARWDRLLGHVVMIRAHVASWIIHFGSVPNGMEVCHSCDNGLCVRPDHLWLGSHAENMADCKTKGRARTRKGETHGMAKLSDQQVCQIRELYSPSQKNGETLARTFGVTRQQIWHIVHGYQR